MCHNPVLVCRGYFGTPQCVPPATGTAQIKEVAPKDWGTLTNFFQCDTKRTGQLQSPIEVPPGVDYVQALRYEVMYDFPQTLECATQSCKISNTGYSMRVGPFPSDEYKLLKIGKVFDDPVFDDKHYVLNHIEFKWGQVPYFCYRAEVFS